MGRGKQEKYNRKVARRRTEGHIYLLLQLLSLTQHNLKSLYIMQLHILLLTQPVVGWAPGTLLSQLKHSRTMSFTTPSLAGAMHHLKRFYHMKTFLCHTAAQYLFL